MSDTCWASDDSSGVCNIWRGTGGLEYTNSPHESEHLNIKFQNYWVTQQEYWV